MLTVGGVTFESGGATFDELAHEVKARWAEVSRLKSAPAQQWIGKDIPTISLQGLIYTTYSPGGEAGGAVGSHTLDEFVSMVDAGEPVTVSSGRGENYGMWIVRSFHRTDTALIDNGAPKKQQFTLNLSFYSE
jgi:phage protein U